MTSGKSRQSPAKNCKEKSALAELINERLAELNWTQKDLADAANMAESRLSRIMRGSKGKANTVNLNEKDINQIALGLKMGREGRDRLRYAAWPELVYIDEALDKGEGVISLNCRLYENGFQTLGLTVPEE